MNYKKISLNKDFAPKEKKMVAQEEVMRQVESFMEVFTGVYYMTVMKEFNLTEEETEAFIQKVGEALIAENRRQEVMDMRYGK